MTFLGALRHDHVDAPWLNPIEQVFSKLKHLLRKDAARTLEAVCACIGKLLCAFTPQECASGGEGGKIRSFLGEPERPRCCTSLQNPPPRRGGHGQNGGDLPLVRGSLHVACTFDRLRRREAENIRQRGARCAATPVRWWSSPDRVPERWRSLTGRRPVGCRSGLFRPQTDSLFKRNHWSRTAQKRSCRAMRSAWRSMLRARAA
jgi:hypothetical protein